MSIDPVIDGEILMDSDYVYPTLRREQVEQYPEYLDPVTGGVIATIGSFLIRYDDRVVLFDCGVGPKPVFPMLGGALRSSLLSLGVHPDEITDVVFTHLHFDHFGWLTVDGRPTFPKATIHCDRRDWELYVTSGRDFLDWEIGMSNVETDAAPVKFAPYRSSVELFEGDAEILPGITAIDAPGHTPGTVVFRLTSDGESAVILGDLVHLQFELLNLWPFGVADDPAMAMDSMRKIRDLVVEENLPCVGSHFPGLRWGHVVRDRDEYRWVEISDQ